MPVIRKSLLQLIFSGAYLLRWNDKLRPAELLEIDKQAHKMLLACVLCGCAGVLVSLLALRRSVRREP